MSLWSTLDQQTHRAAFWATVIALATGVIQFFLPLDVPGGFEATTSERVAWLTANSSFLFNGLVISIVSGVMSGAEIEAYVAGLSIPLFAALFLFRRASTSSDQVA